MAPVNRFKFSHSKLNSRVLYKLLQLSFRMSGRKGYLMFSFSHTTIPVPKYDPMYFANNPKSF